MFQINYNYKKSYLTEKEIYNSSQNICTIIIITVQTLGYIGIILNSLIFVSF